MSIPGLHEWLDTPQGQYVQRWEHERVDQIVADVFGYNAVQIGLLEHDYLRANRMPFKLYCEDARPGPPRALICDPVQLPFPATSVDLVVLPHVLEFAADPHAVLREVERVLVPEGHVLVTGFNPFSLWGACRRLSEREPFPWNGDWLSVPRLRDWFKLLSLDTQAGCFGCYCPPVRSEKWLARWHFMEAAGDRWWPFLGGTYVLQGIKRVHGMRLIMPTWRDRSAAARALATVSTRTQKHSASDEQIGA
jgi:SAM-dependent methyltransferase